MEETSLVWFLPKLYKFCGINIFEQRCFGHCHRVLCVHACLCVCVCARFTLCVIVCVCCERMFLYILVTCNISPPDITI